MAFLDQQKIQVVQHLPQYKIPHPPYLTPGFLSPVQAYPVLFSARVHVAIEKKKTNTLFCNGESGRDSLLLSPGVYYQLKLSHHI